MIQIARETDPAMAPQPAAHAPADQAPLEPQLTRSSSRGLARQSTAERINDILEVMLCGPGLFLLSPVHFPSPESFIPHWATLTSWLPLHATSPALTAVIIFHAPPRAHHRPAHTSSPIQRPTETSPDD